MLQVVLNQGIVARGIMTESSADAPRPTPPSTHPSKRGKKGPLRKMKAHRDTLERVVLGDMGGGKERDISDLVTESTLARHHYVCSVKIFPLRAAIMTESSADAPRPTPPSTHPSKRGKKGPLRKMKEMRAETHLRE
jgi:hypothetical protein